MGREVICLLAAIAPPGRRNVLHGFPPRLSGYDEKCVVCQK
jgi:hypothetical protein